MTMMFAPRPVERRRFGPRDLLSFGPADDPFWQIVRRKQVRYMASHLPLLVLVICLNSAVVILSLADKAHPFAIGVWFLVQTGTTLMWSGRRYVDRRIGVGSNPDRAFMRRLLLEMLALGVAWGLLCGDLLLRVELSYALLVVVMAMATIVAMTFPTSVFPLGTIALVMPVVAGLFVGFLRPQHPDLWMVTVLLGGFLVLVLRGNLLSGIAFLSRMRTEQELVAQEEVVRLLLNEYDANGSEWLYEVAADGSITFLSSRFAEVTDTPIEQIIGTNWLCWLPTTAATQQLSDTIRRAQPFRDFLLPVEIDGERRWWSLSGTPKLGRDGQLLGYRGVGSDVTDRERTAERIAELAACDTLTGLVNRRLVHQALVDGLENGGVALLFIDLDRFKAVNDSLGHGAGDRLLVQVADRLRAATGEWPAGKMMPVVGRLGGDEFAAVLRGSTQQEALHLGETIIAMLSAPYQLGDQSATIGASIGLALGPEDGATVELLMRAADLALYDAKGHGRGQVRAYDRAMHRRSEERLALEFDLKSALDSNQLSLVFQPVVDAIDERVVAFEALIRWRHPVHGQVSPATFIPIAEEIGLIGRIGAWVLNEACRVASAWPRHIGIAVNLSPLQFDDPGLVSTVRDTLDRWKLSPERLELELTESVFLDERAQTADMLAELQDLGVSFALDDFGTGYSSLGYLRKVPFSRIKIDRSFVQASAADAGESTAIIQAIVALADRLGMQTTAEGTETRAEFEAMRRLGCGQMQGWYFGRPVPAEETARLLDRNRPAIELVDDGAISPLPPMLQAASARSRGAAAPSSRRLR